MIIIQVAGGLGNQLQQYALYQKFKSLGAEAKLDLSWFDQFENKQTQSGQTTVTTRRCELDFFEGLTYDCCTEAEKRTLIGSDGIFGKLRRKLLPRTVHWYKESEMYDPSLLNYRNMYLSGYFACEKYYGDILPELREQIRFPGLKKTTTQTTVRSANLEILEKIQNCHGVSVHIRRGDYLQPENAAMFGNICTEEYYRSALSYMKEQLDHPHFFIFSDDPDYVRQHYSGEEYTIVDINHGDNSCYDMYLMSRCQGNICANSTFSFWGARLNDRPDKIMIRPTKQKNRQVFEEEKMKELWKGWIFVDPQGEIF